MSDIEQLLKISRFYGKNADFVLAGGGNTSIKSADILYIKPSGITLAAINKEEFRKIWRFKNYISHTIVKQKEFIKLISKDFKLIAVKQSDSDKYDFYPLKLFIAKRK